MARDEPVFMGIIASLFFICSSQISRNVVVTIVIASFIIPVSQVAPFISSASQATCTELRPYITKGNLTCFACPPGFYLYGHSTTNNTIAVCRVCPQGYYSGVSGVHTRCERCSPYCESDNLIEVSNCSSTTNLTCDCPPGKVLKDPHDKHRAICLDETTKKGNASTHNQTKADPDSDDFSIVKEDINDTKKDVKTLKKNVRAIKKDVGRLKEDVGAVKDTLNTLLKEINYIEGEAPAESTSINVALRGGVRGGERERDLPNGTIGASDSPRETAGAGSRDPGTCCRVGVYTGQQKLLVDSNSKIGARANAARPAALASRGLCLTEPAAEAGRERERLRERLGGGCRGGPIAAGKKAGGGGAYPGWKPIPPWGGGGAAGKAPCWEKPQDCP
ncbi:uncharacterized protein LOC110460900 [Mizuhopecten yessoensis]|uniref:uncharacterized protein LOC110460900 n=1 Tax=Mizuhopecten yessoensis TaxID=6573 RepID=UPI000B4584D5|nr:uncharacterized protein LOC110460900 [Mizuhopecten yessoensis]